MNTAVRNKLAMIAAMGWALGVAVADEATAGGWLGVQLGEVPPPLVSHLGLTDSGVIVQNIVKDSPADRAGLQRWDVVTHVDGQAIPASSTVLADAVQSKNAGAAVTLAVRRGGQETSVPVTLAERPADIRPDQWKYERSEGDVLRERVKSHGGILSRDPTGAWTWNDIGDSDVLVNLPPDVRKMLQRFSGSTTRVYDGESRRSMSISVERDGQTIEVTRENDGPFVVRRREKGSERDSATEKSYADENALQTGDEDAYEAYRDATHQGAFDGAFTTPLPPSFRPDGSAWDHLQGALDRYRGEMRQELEKLPDVEEALKQAWSGQQWPTFGVPSVRELRSRLQGSAPASEVFRVEPDGRIELTRRSGETEVTEVYRDEGDLKARNPSAFERYRSVRGGETK